MNRASFESVFLETNFVTEMLQSSANQDILSSQLLRFGQNIPITSDDKIIQMQTFFIKTLRFATVLKAQILMAMFRSKCFNISDVYVANLVDW